jgi:FkbM family methyltransferase
VCDMDNINGFDERVVLLPGCYQPNDEVLPDIDSLPLRSAYGLPNEAFVLCSFNQYYKYSPETIKVWSEILRECNESILWMLAPEQSLHERILEVFEKHGVPSEKIYFANKVHHDEHVRRLALADLMLDNWPYNAHTTCSDALRAGTPIVTLPGKTFASRVAASILKTANLDDWIAKDVDDYRRIALNFSKLSRSAIDDVKRRTRSAYSGSALVDSRSFAKNLESFYFAAVRRASEGLAPHDFRVQTDGVTIFDRESLGTSSPSKDCRKTSTKGIAAGVSSQQDDGHRVVGPKLDNDLRIAQQLQQLLTEQQPLVVDVGAADIDGDVGYEKFADVGLVRVLGFEPSPQSYEKLAHSSRPNRKYLNIALGDGKDWQLRICQAPGMNSLLEVDRAYLDCFPMFSKWATKIGEIGVPTTRLDDVKEAFGARFLKLDIQGFESVVLENAVRLLDELSVIQVELSPTPIYRGERSLFEVGTWLEERGYALHHFKHLNRRGFKPVFGDATPFAATNFVFQVDAVFVPSFKDWGKLTVERLEGLAFFMHILYKSYDLVGHALQSLDARDGGDRYHRYFGLLKHHRLMGG